MLVSPACRDLALVTHAACREAGGEAGGRGEGFHTCGRSLLYKKEVVCFPQARKTLVLLPYVMEQLQGDDSDARAAALPVLGNMLRLLEGKTSSRTALELAEKLRPLFEDVRVGETPAPPLAGHLHSCLPLRPPCSAGGCFAPKPPDPIPALGSCAASQTLRMDSPHLTSATLPCGGR